MSGSPGQGPSPSPVDAALGIRLALGFALPAVGGFFLTIGSHGNLAGVIAGLGIGILIDGVLIYRAFKGFM